MQSPAQLAGLFVWFRLLRDAQLCYLAADLVEGRDDLNG
jgi:hypothetical protein